MIIHVLTFKQNTDLVSDFKSGADEHLETLKFNQPKVSGTNIPRNPCLGCPTHKHIIRTCFSVGTITSFQKNIKMDPWPFSDTADTADTVIPQSRKYINIQDHMGNCDVYIYMYISMYIYIYHVCQSINIYIYIHTRIYVCVVEFVII